jgi:hypothetical protein
MKGLDQVRIPRGSLVAGFGIFGQLLQDTVNRR